MYCTRPNRTNERCGQSLRVWPPPSGAPGGRRSPAGVAVVVARAHVLKPGGTPL